MSVNYRSKQSQAGMVSIIVTMVMMVVISLIVLGFAQISRREERQALDQQLSTQAFLAAETGINDAYEAIRGAIISGNPNPYEEKDYCGAPTDPSSIYAGQTNVLDPPTNSVSYTCLMVSTKLHDIVQSVPSDGTSVTLPLHPGDAATKIHQLNVTWKAPSTVSSVASCAATVPPISAGPLPPSSAWQCPYGLLRLELVPTDGPQLNRTALMANQLTTFLYPTQSAAGTINYGSAKGAVAGMRCNTAGCKIAITNFPLSFTNYQIRLSSTYGGGVADVSAYGPGGAGAGPIELKDAQIAIDSTGKAEDVMRRIQARMSLSGSSQAPTFTLESGSSICKRFGVGSGLSISGIIGQDSNNPYCGTLAATPPAAGPPAADQAVCNGGASDIMFVIDSSDSMRNPWASLTPGGPRLRRYEVEQQVMANFFQGATLGQNGNHVAIVQFNDVATTLINYSWDQAALNAAMANLTIEQGTRFSAGLNQGNALMTMPGSTARPGVKKVVIFMTDGEPSPLTEGPAGVASADIMKARGVEIYGIGILSELYTKYNYVPDIASDAAHYADANDTVRFNQVLTDIARNVSCK